MRGVRERKRFQEVIKRLEALKVCESLDFRSYLMLPMQRVTRLPLLISAVVKRFTTGTPEHTAYNDALIAMNKVNYHVRRFLHQVFFNWLAFLQVVRECDEGAKRCACIEELCRIDAVLHFDVSLKVSGNELAISSPIFRDKNSLFFAENSHYFRFAFVGQAWHC